MDALEIISFVIKGFIFTQIKITIMVVGKIIPHMDMVSSDIFREFCMRVNGYLTNKMGMVSSIGLTELYSKANSKEVRRRKADFLGPITATMKDNSLMISLKVRAHFFGKIIEVMLEVGKQTKCMA